MEGELKIVVVTVRFCDLDSMDDMFLVFIIFLPFICCYKQVKRNRRKNQENFYSSIILEWGTAKG